MKFAFIAAENACNQFEVNFMCRELEVSKSGYYAFRKRGLSQRRREDLALVPLIHAEFEKHPRGCGSRMVAGALRQQGRAVSRKRVVRLMQDAGLQARAPTPTLERRRATSRRRRAESAGSPIHG